MRTRTQELSGVVGRVTPCAPMLANEKTARRGLAHPTGITIFLLMLGLVTTMHAQNYSIDWYKIAGGGGTSTGRTYQVSGTIGQSDACGAMSGGNYSLTGGFWSLISMVQAPGVPNLSIAHSGNSVIVFWPNTGSYPLQQNANLAPANWVTSGYTNSTSNGTNSITLTPLVGNLSFRLKR